ncbi:MULTISPECIES: AbiH family protein [unclassified Faecalibacillus]|uniref:AbiH family protein n=1 Tax=unclassified Faecalibacillus TaxID=2678890 RepID=UPI001D0AC356|nr:MULTISPECIES: AbiH family protein [unclassified Faecalibacillus]MCB8540771.1 bacteriophage abortive infection AbiH family protein [Faecalibacillus sp. TM498]MCB8558456.1 bacteriophage abortive infection AbiH family protein [Faecalibacillus sp. TM111]
MNIDTGVTRILLIGNGFDLAHGLPTSYSYFLDFCDKVSRMFTYLMHIDDKAYEKSALNTWDVDDSIKDKLLEWYKKEMIIQIN